MAVWELFVFIFSVYVSAEYAIPAAVEWVNKRRGKIVIADPCKGVEP